MGLGRERGDDYLSLGGLFSITELTLAAGRSMTAVPAEHIHDDARTPNPRDLGLCRRD